MGNTLYAGVARRAINPRLGTPKVGMRLFADPIPAIESDLTGTVLVLANDKAKIAIIATDLCVIAPSEGVAIRKQVADAISAPVSHVMLNLSHNHSAPGLPGWIKDPVPENSAMKQRYQEELVRWLKEAAVEANQKLQPARIGAGWGDCRIGAYRREFRQDEIGRASCRERV